MKLKKDKFIICNYTPNKINDLVLFGYIYKSIEQGKISNDDTEYCYLTSFGKDDRDLVAIRKTKYGYKIDVYNDNELNNMLERK